MEKNDMDSGLYSLIPAGPDEKGMFYSDETKPPERACIGHFRGYYRDGGKMMYSNWFDHQSELNIPEFRNEFNQFIDDLIKCGILDTRQHLERFCLRHPEARIAGVEYKDTYGFRTDSEKYSLYLRLSLMPGDYAIYCYAYNRDILHEQAKIPPPKKRNGPER
ncbi:MAG: hypothetical protein PHH65_09525 [Eubacteriales bacterium]|nr:hypothetical protein [Eubacteriales bacterium]